MKFCRRHTWICIALCFALPLTACGTKGKLKTPSQAAAAEAKNKNIPKNDR